MEREKSLKKIPVSVSISVLIIFVFSLYFTSVIKELPCSKDMTSNLYSNFVHVDTYHMMVNLFALYSISRVEEDIGHRNFFGLILFLVILNTVFMTFVHKLNSNVRCSIGFSGILFGIMTWELISNKGVDGEILMSIFLMIILPSLKNKKVSLVGHTVGAFSGIVGGLLWKKFMNGD